MIAIDIPMPSRCAFCNFLNKNAGENQCILLYDRLITNILDERPSFCPLLKVEHLRDKTVERSLLDFAQVKDPKSKEELDKAVKKIHASRLGAFIFDHPELIRFDCSDDYDTHLRYYTTDCYVVKSNKEEKQK